MQIGVLFILPMVPALAAKECKCSSSLMSSSIGGATYLTRMECELTMPSTQNFTVVKGVHSANFLRALEMLIHFYYEMMR